MSLLVSHTLSNSTSSYISKKAKHLILHCSVNYWFGPADHNISTTLQLNILCGKWGWQTEPHCSCHVLKLEKRVFACHVSNACVKYGVCDIGVHMEQPNHVIHQIYFAGITCHTVYSWLISNPSSCTLCCITMIMSWPKEYIRIELNLHLNSIQPHIQPFSTSLSTNHLFLPP